MATESAATFIKITQFIWTYEYLSFFQWSWHMQVVGSVTVVISVISVLYRTVL